MTANKPRILSDLAKVDAHVIQPEEYDEAPEWTAEDFAKAVVRKPGRPPVGDAPKVAIKLRLDANTIETYRATGAGWQTKINDDLREAASRLKKQVG